MGFFFRTVFWLALAMVVLPPQARLGGGETTDISTIDVGAALADAKDSAMAIGHAALNTCESNPGLCLAGQALWTDTVATVTHTVSDAEKQWQKPGEKPRRVAALTPSRTKKIQARVE